MNNISIVKNCYGCLACVDRCPVKCISVGETSIGHTIPSVNEDECIECGACLKVCPDIEKPKLNIPLKTVASWAKSEEVRSKSSSGALASIIAEKFISNGGVVYGCAFVPPFEFRHIRCSHIEDLSKLRGSKYVQSNTNGIFKNIKEDISEGLKVLFIGTPCQVAAIRKYIGESKQLFSMDLVCHGVPSLKLLKDSLPPSIWKENITNVNFRNSTKYQITIKNGETIVYERGLKDNLYLKAFFIGLDYRESCYKCQFAQKERVGDISLGDFWGVKLNVSSNEKEKGISLCLVNTDRGVEMMKAVEDEVRQNIRPLQEATAENLPLKHPMKKTSRATLFRKLYPILGFNFSVIMAIPEVYIKNKLFR